MKKLARSFFIAACSLACLSQPRAELLVGLTIQNSLITFDSASPGTVTGPVPIVGLLAGDTLVGIDRRPQNGPNNGLLYGLGVNFGSGTGRIYTLNVTTGAATPGSLLSADPADVVAPFPFTTVNGRTFGVDFNPVEDRLRVVSGDRQNLRINVDNGLVQLDVPLAYQAGDQNVGGPAAHVDNVAYSNNIAGATTTVLWGVDGATIPDTWVTITNPNGGTMMSNSSFHINLNAFRGFDISGLTGNWYFVNSPVGGGTSQLVLANNLSDTIGGGVQLIGLAAPVGVPDGGSTLLLLVPCLVGLGLLRHLKRRA